MTKRIGLGLLATLLALLCGGLAMGEAAALAPSPYAEADFAKGIAGLSIQTDRPAYSIHAGTIPYYVVNESGLQSPMFGRAMALEMRQGDTWVSIPMHENFAWTLEGLTLTAGDVYKDRVHMIAYNHVMQPGEYRIVKEIDGIPYAGMFTLVTPEAYRDEGQQAQPLVLLTAAQRTAFDDPKWADYTPVLWQDTRPAGVEANAVQYADGERDGAFAIMQKDGRQNVLCFLQQTAEGSWSVADHSDGILRSGPVLVPQELSFFNYSNDGLQYMYDTTSTGPWDEGGTILRGDDGWQVTSFYHYDEAARVEFQVVTEDDLSRLIWGHPVDGRYQYVGAADTLPLAFGAFDRAEILSLADQAYAQRNDPKPVPPSGAEDSLPEPVLVDFPAGKQYAVYTGPGKHYMRAGAGGNASVSTSGWIQVFGVEGDWALIQYNVNDTTNRFGYIARDALPEGTQVPELAFSAQPLSPVPGGFITDDPLRNELELVLVDAGSAGAMSRLGSIFGWLYVEYTPAEGKPIRGFIRENDA